MKAVILFCLIVASALVLVDSQDEPTDDYFITEDFNEDLNGDGIDDGYDDDDDDDDDDDENDDDDDDENDADDNKAAAGKNKSNNGLGSKAGKNNTIDDSNIIEDDPTAPTRIQTSLYRPKQYPHPPMRIAGPSSA